MTDSIYSQDLINLIKEYNNKIPRSHNIKKKYPNLFQLLLKETKFLPNNSIISTRFWHIRNNTKDIPLCKHCKKNTVKWHSCKNGYVDYCSALCVGNSEKTLTRKKQTCLEKFGVDSYSKTDKFKQIFQSEEYLKTINSLETKEKKKQTSLERYGVEHSLQSSIVKEKIKQTNLERYGVENAGGTVESQEKIKQTIKNRYGVEHYNQTEEFKKIMNEYHNNDEAMYRSQEKQRNTMQCKYGVNYTFELESVQKKIKAKFDLNYNGRHPTQVHISHQAFTNLNDYNWLKKQHHDLERTASSIAFELQVNVSTVLDYLKKHLIEVKKFNSSEPEKEIAEFIRSISSNIEMLRNTKSIIKPYELDIYLPEYNLAIEYNGLFWHSEGGGKNEKYHLMKTEMCEAKGIRLIHIFENEWRDQRQKVMDTIKHFLGKSSKGVYARNTTIREISWKIAKDFLNQYHLLGSGISGNYRIGAFDKNNNLIGVMVFGQSNNESGDVAIELKRFVTDKKNNPGLGSKLFKYAINNKQYNEVIAFVDRRWFTGTVKDHIGFKMVSYTKPALWFTDGEILYHRRFKTKKQLIEDGFDSDLSKQKILKSLGYYRIWDCGKIKLKWTLNK